MQILQIVLTIVTTLLLITLLVFIHELGHFLAAKFFKTDVKEFAIGFGKRLVSREYKGTVYSIRMFPLGGFVELEGENKSISPNSFRNKRAYQKIIILSAGVIMNLLLATVAMTIFLATNNYQFTIPALTEYNFRNTETSVRAFPLMVTEVAEDGNSVGQLNEGDSIIGINNSRFDNYGEFKKLLEDNQGKLVNFEFLDLREFSTYSREIKVGFKDEEGAILNVGLFELNRTSSSISYPAFFLQYPRNLSSGVFLTADLTLYIPKALGEIIGNSFRTGNFSELGNSVGSPLQIVDNSNQIIQAGAFQAFIPLAGLLSISLAIFNILPFPALDGGQIVVVLIEKITRRKIPDATLEKINMFGFIFLMGLGILLIFKDFLQLNVLDKFGEFIQNITQR